ncbi:hypothetical protein [Nonomuraea sp. LPB2021202275-12-8]|uniref:hypothetical protein n=1 Tax=Nonomuraea sp. LPB2021202275-12-8 TaxID=3120159 RepID=UPI00300C18B4
MQVNNLGPITNQTNIDHSVALSRDDLQAGVAQLRSLIKAGAIPESVGSEVVAEVEASLNEANGQPTGRLKGALQRLRDLLAVGGASADDVAKVASAITAISAIVGG